jgi:excinuclease ABC subunit C
MAPLTSPKTTPLSRQPLPSPASWSQSPVSLPSSPGVYWFIGKNAEILYVGKAKNLDHRLKSYSRINHLLPKTKQLVLHTLQVKYQILDSELQALLIEAELIRTHQPHFNILLKDDKSPLYIVISKSDYPSVKPIRRSDLKNASNYRRIFGPFPSSRQVKTVLKLARRLFPYCTICDSTKRPVKACFYSHIHLCPGACTGSISVSDYQLNIKRLELFLSGKHKQILNQIAKDIESFSRQQQFELALAAKQQYQAITYVFSHYRIAQNHQPLPQLSQDLNKEALLSLKNLLYHQGFATTDYNRIETYDVANLMGQSAAVSMVVAIKGQIAKHQYRHFKINTLKTPNDVGMLKEALTRRQHHPEWGLPNLIVIDGGKTQVNGVKSVMGWSVPVIGLAKQPDRLFINHGYIPLNPNHPGSKLLITLRNEAHRFSRRLHHKLDLKQLFE